MKTTTMCCLVLLACLCCHTTGDIHPQSTGEAMTRHDEIRKIMRNHWIHEFETVDDTYWSSAAERRKVLAELRKMKKDYYYESSDPNLPLYVPGPGWAIRGPLTIAQIEQESLQRIRLSPNPDVPQVPFGYDNDQWNTLKSQYKDGDELYFFGLYPHPPYFFGMSGYVLIRGNQIVGLM